ncbi:MAG: hypothetical protein ACPGYV_00940 [Phycisphaeraceae bacterium]
MSQFPPNPSQTPSPAGSGQLVLIGFVIALVAVVLMNVYVEMRVASRDEQQITFFKFRGDIDAGREIEAEDLEAFQVPASMESAFGLDAIREKVDQRGVPRDGVGFKLNAPVVRGQVLKSSLFLGSGSAQIRDPAYKDYDEITLNIDSKRQPTNLRPGDFVDLYATIPLNRESENRRVMEYVKVVNLGDVVQESGVQRGKANKYGSITIYVEPSLSAKLFDIQERVLGKTFNVTRRDPRDKRPRELKTGGSEEINAAVLELLGID